ncbi:GGDEF domain-containing protein [Butyrivibrio sp. X503]|uniref:GGDEF domain-containing protein n=1 Tax=Butyrivibrio sp. X503 TaxID=2364878 RepID=UPI000EAA5AB8|nr:GGDEF domain-containing protein [Butyrivibrio sp. X503]RKM57260.1 GGDEF domain-containing protein [Butyrivibrio sp. X503]
MNMACLGDLVINIYTFSLAMMLLIFQENDRKSKSNLSFTKLIGILAILVIASALIDIGVLVGGTFTGFSKFATYVIFALDPFGFLFAINYIDCFVKKDELVDDLSGFFIMPVKVYAISNFVLVTFSTLFKFNWFYLYDIAGYHRGQLFYVRLFFHAMACFCILAYIIYYRNAIISVYRTPLLALPIIVGVGIVSQFVISGINFAYAATVFAFLILFIYVQRCDVNMDYLTGVVNRRGIDKALKKAAGDGMFKSFSVIMVDIDYFKLINDRFGHRAGDEVLSAIADILKETFDDDTVVGRFGGDEFCVVTSISDEKILKERVDSIKKAVSLIEWSNMGEMELSVSTGISVFKRNSKMQIKDLIDHADRMMYEEKTRHHLAAGL